MPNARFASPLVLCAASFWAAGCGLDDKPTDDVSRVGGALTENLPPTVDAGPDLTIIWPAAAPLHGAFSDDFLPDPMLAGARWSVVSGPGDVTFREAFAPDATAVFSQEGTYVLRLTGSDGELSAFDEVTVTVVRSPLNQAPIIELSEPLVFGVGELSTLGAQLRDDLLPSPPAALTVMWTLVSGPGHANIFIPSAPITSVIVDTAGYYTFQLTVSDGELSTSATQVYLFHRGPVLDAGPDQTIVLPNSAQLNGTATDDGFPEPSTIVAFWYLAEGPGPVTFANDLGLTNTASFSVPGTYVFVLAGHDGSTGSNGDSMIVTVLPEHCDRHEHGRGRGHEPGHSNGHGHNCR